MTVKSNLPYVTASGNIKRAIEKIMAVSVPPKVSGDFVKNVLKIKGGSGDQMTSFLKKIGLADSSGSPTSLYTQLRNPVSSGNAIASAMRHAYEPLFFRNEYANKLNDDDLKGLIIEETGQAHDSNSVKMTFSSFKALNELADFSENAAPKPQMEIEENDFPHTGVNIPNPISTEQDVKLNIGYTINLNLPATNDISVFNAIFKSLKENLLRNEND